MMIEALRGVIRDARTAETYDKRDPIIDEALRRLDNIAKRVDPSRFGKKGGKKTAERGPEYFAKIAAMRKTRGGGRPKKQPASPQA